MRMRKKLGNEMDFDYWAMEYVDDAQSRRVVLIVG
jgi:hypothetical protein